MCDPLEWPRWWRGCRWVRELEPGGESRVGARYECEWRGRAPYPVRFDYVVCEVDAPRLMRGVSTGYVDGEGTWRLLEEDGLTTVTHDWTVRLARMWMRTLPRSLLRANHDRVMRRGEEGLAATLAT